MLMDSIGIGNCEKYFRYFHHYTCITHTRHTYKKISAIDSLISMAIIQMSALPIFDENGPLPTLTFLIALELCLSLSLFL